jgi:hypothetical protein
MTSRDEWMKLANRLVLFAKHSTRCKSRNEIYATCDCGFIEVMREASKLNDRFRENKKEHEARKERKRGRSLDNEMGFKP